MNKKAKPTAHIEGWYIRGVSPLYRLVGHVTKHDRQADFKTDTQETSQLVRLDLEAGTAETANTMYTLGKPLSREFGG